HADIVQIPIGIVEYGHQGVGLVGEFGRLPLEFCGGIARNVLPKGGKGNEEGGEPDQDNDEQGTGHKYIEPAELKGNLFLKGALVENDQAVLVKQLPLDFLSLFFILC